MIIEERSWKLTGLGEKMAIKKVEEAEVEEEVEDAGEENVVVEAEAVEVQKKVIGIKMNIERRRKKLKLQIAWAVYLLLKKSYQQS
jgi:hypothetical protein